MSPIITHKFLCPPTQSGDEWNVFFSMRFLPTQLSIKYYCWRNAPRNFKIVTIFQLTYIHQKWTEDEHEQGEKEKNSEQTSATIEKKNLLNLKYHSTRITINKRELRAQKIYFCFYFCVLNSYFIAFHYKSTTCVCCTIVCLTWVSSWIPLLYRTGWTCFCQSAFGGKLMKIDMFCCWFGRLVS